MKKAFVALMVVAMALVAQANVWSVDWSVLAALAPEDPGDMSVSLFDNYGITWELFNATAGETIASTSLINGTIEWDDRENGGSKATYSDWLIAESTTGYMGSTSLGKDDGPQSVYQIITLCDKNDPEKKLWYWQSDPASVIPTDEATGAAMALGGEVIIAAEGVSIPGYNMAAWKPVPEPATMSLLGLGALAMILRRRIRR